MVAMMAGSTTTVQAFSPVARQPRAALLSSSVGKAGTINSSFLTMKKNNNNFHARRAGSSSSIVIRQMSSDPEGEQQKQPTISSDGTFYDDEIDSAPVKDGISDSMKARLMREASTGLDSDKAQTNVILYIILGVSVLVLLGGAGIFY